MKSKFITITEIFNAFGIDAEIREMNTGNLYPNHKTKYYIDKITTTNSTGILEVQNSDRLEVVDCVQFF